MEQRLSILSNWLQDNDIAFACITSTPNVFYFTRFYSEPYERLLAAVIFPEQEPFLVCPALDQRDAKNSGWPYDIITYTDTENGWEKLKKAVRNRKLTDSRKIAIEATHLTYQRTAMLAEQFPGCEFVPCETIIAKARMKKDKKEIQLLQEAARLADFGVEVGVNAIASGKTELDIVAEIEYELKKKGVRNMSFPTLVLTGAKTASPHGEPDTTEIKKGDFVLFDLGVQLEGYCSDITRTVVFGTPTETQLQIYEAVKNGQQEALAQCKAKNAIRAIDKAARDYITEKGFGEYFIHRTGHGLGIEAHELPSITETSHELLEAGYVITVEPGVYVEGVGGARIEDDVVITENGAQILTQFPKKLLQL